MNILFLCVANSARSQIAEGLAKSMLGKEHRIESAGSSPSGKVHPHAISTMKEMGIDISNHFSKSVDELDKDFIDNLDFVITLCAEEICPVFDNSCKKIHWMNVDPDNKDFNDSQLKSSFESTRINIYNLLKKFFTEML